MAEINEQLLSALETARSRGDTLFDTVRKTKATDGTQLEFSSNFDTGQGFQLSIEDLYKRYIIAMDLASLAIDVLDITVMPSNFVGELRSSLEGIANQAANSPIPSNAQNINNLDVQTQNGPVSMAKFFRNLNGQIDNFLIVYYKITPATKDKKFKDFSLGYKSLVKQIENAEKLKKQLENWVSQSQKMVAEIEGSQKSSTSNKSLIEQSVAVVERQKGDMQQYESEASKLLGQLKAVSAEAASLKVQVSEYQSKFTTFDENLDERNEAYTSWETKNQELIKSVKSKSEDLLKKITAEYELYKDQSSSLLDNVKGLVKRAEDMLAGATVASLSTSFDKLKDKFAGELESERKRFYFAVILLAISSIPLAWHYFTAERIDIVQVTARVIIMLPFVWVTVFTVARHNLFFRLREHYTYKYSMAMSVEGFQKKSPKHEEDIAALTFVKLSDNPADKMEAKQTDLSETTSIGNMLMKKILEFLGLDKK